MEKTTQHSCHGCVSRVFLGHTMTNQPHQKTRKSHNIPNHAHFLTFSCHQHLPLLDSDRTRAWFIESLKVMRQKLDVAVVAYVIMPEHVHLLIRPRSHEYEISKILASCKRSVSMQAREWLTEHDPAWIQRLTVRRGDRTDFRFWQAGGGDDENITSTRSIEEIASYIHANPVRRGLVSRATDWEWSSARFWAGIEDVRMAMDRAE